MIFGLEIRECLNVNISSGMVRLVEKLLVRVFRAEQCPNQKKRQKPARKFAGVLCSTKR